MHTMSKDTNYTQISFDELVELKIPALSGREAKNNTKILRSVALHGSMLKYDIFKNAKIDYHSTVSRRVDSLVKREYLKETGTRFIRRGKRTEESEYGLTWRGFIASLTIKEVRKNFVPVLKINQLLTFPEKELVLPLLEEFLTTQEVEIITKPLLEAYLKTIPSIEFVKNEPMNVLSSLFSIREIPELPEGFMLSKLPQNKEELLKLLDKPIILNTIKNRLLPLIREKTLEVELVHRFMLIFNELGNYISTLEVEDQPSKKIVEYAKTKLIPKLSEISDLSNALEEQR